MKVTFALTETLARVSDWIAGLYFDRVGPLIFKRVAIDTSSNVCLCLRAVRLHNRFLAVDKTKSVDAIMELKGTYFSQNVCTVQVII